MRSSGILLSVSSLPSEFGIGGFGEEAVKFAEFVKNGGCSWWQVLPITTIGMGNSPYSGVSAFAGNYLYIDPMRLYKKGYISRQDMEDAKYHGTPHTVDYGFVTAAKKKLIAKAYEKISAEKGYLLDAYLSENKEWLLGYALYMAIKDSFDGKPWYDWTPEFKFRENAAISEFIATHDTEIRYYIAEQFLFDEQWRETKREINGMGVRIIGDMPIYVSLDSVDVWSRPENYELNEETLEPASVAGVPPDYFSATGQLWGNPIYNYTYMKKNKYKWFLDRFKRMFDLYDKLRIDHFRAFDRYWAVDKGESTAINGKWLQGCGAELFALVRKKFPNADIIAEDLGVIDEGVINLRKKFGFPGMRVLHFAFDSDNSPHIPHNYDRESVVYTGTHDNNTTYGWIMHMDSKSFSKLQDYIGEYDNVTGGENNRYVWSCIRVMMQSVADTVIIPFQDLAGWGEDTRLNIPGVADGNWVVRITYDAMNRIQLDKLLRYNFITDRLAK